MPSVIVDVLSIILSVCLSHIRTLFDASQFTSNVSHDVGKIIQSQLAFSLELTAT